MVIMMIPTVDTVVIKLVDSTIDKTATEDALLGILVLNILVFCALALKGRSTKTIWLTESEA